MHTKLRFVAFAAALAAASGASAQNYYAGVSGGIVDHHADQSDWQTAGATTKFDEYEGGIKIFGGYQFNEHWGVELTYAHLGSYQAKIATAGDFGTADVDVSSINLLATGTVPLAHGFSVFGKLGVSHNYSDMEFRGTTGAAFNTFDSGTKSRLWGAFGVGAAYRISDGFEVRVEYEDYGKAGESNGGFTIAGKTSESRPKMWSIGIVGSF